MVVRIVQRQGKVFGSIDEIRECETALNEILTLFKEFILLAECAEVPLKARGKYNEVADAAVEDMMIRLIADGV